ncbi:sugar ABC transporter permease [Spirochaetia bacterium]|nr:sugar ABC transporter permease [Spirochaetia bacterium]
MKFRKSSLFVFLSLVLAVMPLAAGGQSGSSGAAAQGPVGKIDYPIKTNVTLTYWSEMHPNLSSNYANYGDAPYMKGLVERTGIKVEYLHPPTGGGSEQFNLIIASGDLPDIMEWNWLNYPGGPENAISDNIILKLNDTMQKYSPNLVEVLKSNPAWDRMLKTDLGSYYYYPLIRGDPSLCIYLGPQIRKDWLDELKLSLPVTYDDWHTVLTAFKQMKNSPAPLILQFYRDSFVYGYGIASDFYIGTDGKVKYGRIDPAFRSYLTMVAQWYKEGLLDPDIATVTDAQVAQKVVSGAAGATIGSLGGNMGVWIPAARATNPTFELVAAAYPVVKKGDKPFMIDLDNPVYPVGPAITASSKNIELAARLLDYGYSKEGGMYSNYGTEGVSYNMINGYPTFTDLIMKNPQGWPLAQSISAYARSPIVGPFVQAKEYLEQYFALPEQKAAPSTWAISDPYKYKMPPVTPSPAESQEFARIMSEINTYVNEMRVKFILGTEPISNFDAYVNIIKRMGIDRAIEIQNAALARYNAR